MPAREYVIYMHKSPSGKVYIGQTCQKVTTRWGHDGHQYTLKHKDGSYLHPGFAPAVIKYGWDKIEHHVLFSGLSKLEADMIEMDLIHFYKKGNKCYNSADGGEGGAGVGMKRIRQYNRKTGALIKEWSSINEAEASLNINNIGACCHRKRNLAGDWIWRYAEEQLVVVNPKEGLCKQSRPVIQYDLDGNELFRYDRIQDAVLKTGISKKSIQECCIHRQKSGGGYIWKYVDENFKRNVNTNMIASGAKAVGQYDIDGNLLAKYFSANEASRKTGICASTITQCCRLGRYSTKFKCYWKWL